MFIIVLEFNTQVIVLSIVHSLESGMLRYIIHKI